MDEVYRNNERGIYHVTFTNTNEEILNDYLECFENLSEAVKGIQMALNRGSFTINTSSDELKLKFQVGQSNLKKWLQNYQYCISDLVNQSTRELFQQFKDYVYIYTNIDNNLYTISENYIKVNELESLKEISQLKIEEE